MWITLLEIEPKKTRTESHISSESELVCSSMGQMKLLEFFT